MLPSSAAATPAAGLLNDGRLITFDTTAPGTITSGPTTVKGLQAGERLVAIDVRPATGILFGVGSSSRLYAVDLGTAQATQFGASGQFTLAGTAFGADFNPFADRLRVDSDSEQNLRLNPNDGTLFGTDTSLAYDAGDPNQSQNPNVTAVAYTNNFVGPPSTTLFGIDTGLDLLVIQTPPNDGTLFTVGSLAINAASNAGFDIVSTSAPTNTAFAALTPVGSPNSGLYVINLASGAAALVGPIGSGVLLDGLALGVTALLPVDPPPAGDTVAPETTIVSKKLKKRAKGKATIEFAGSDNVTAATALAFACRRDAKAFAPCTSPVAFKKLKPGKHTIEIRAVDGAGNADASPASLTFKVRRKRR